MRTLATFLVQLAIHADGPRTTRTAPFDLPITRFSRLADGTYLEETVR